VKGCHVNADKIPFHEHSTQYVSVDQIRINHYWSRDEAFLLHIKYARYQQYKLTIPLEEIKRKGGETYNQVYDPIMDRFVPTLRAKMGLY
jgi:hypothetical protein